MTKRKIGDNRGNAGKGRPKGSPNKTTAVLKEAIIAAAEVIGRDGKGKDGLTGYCCYLAQDEPKAFATLLGRVLPTQLTGADGGAVQARIVIVPAKELIEPPQVRALEHKNGD